MNERAFKLLGSHGGRNNFANVSSISIGGTFFSMVIFGTPPRVISQPVVAPKSKKKKRVAPISTNLRVGGR